MNGAQLCALAVLAVASFFNAAQAQNDLEVRGQVIEKQTGKPLAGITVNGLHRVNGLQGEAPFVITDAQGRFTQKVPPARQLSLYIHPKEFQYFNRRFEVPAGATTLDVGRLELIGGFQVSGVALDDAKNPIAGARMLFKYKIEGYTADIADLADTSKTGAFQSRVLPPGPISITMDHRSGWEIVPDNLLKIELSKDTKPLTLTARKLAVQSATGRVVSLDKKPIANALVEVMVEGEGTRADGTKFNYSEPQRLTTDGEGRFVVPRLLNNKGITIHRITAPGWAVRKLGKVTQANGQWTIADSVLVASTGIVRGRVVDSKGQPVADALVMSPVSREFSPVSTKNDGTFEIRDLSAEEVEIYAAKDNDFASMKVKIGMPCELRLAPPRRLTPPMRRQLLEQLPQIPTTLLIKHRSQIGTQGMLFYALQSDNILPPALPRGPAPKNFEWREANWKNAGHNARIFLESSFYADPEWLAENAVEIAALLPPTAPQQLMWFEPLCKMAQCAVLYGDDNAKKWAAHWLDGAFKMAADKNHEAGKNVITWFGLASVAALLGRPNAKDYVLRALEIAASNNRKITYWEARALALGGPELFEVLENECTLEERIEALAAGIQVTAQLHPDAAQQLYQKLLALPESDEDKELLAKTPRIADMLRFRRLEVLRDLAVAKAAENPDEALGFLQQSEHPAVQGDFSRAQFRVVRGVLEAKRPDIAGKVLKPLLSSTLPIHAEAGGLALAFDAPLATQFFDKARPLTMRRGPEFRLADSVNYGQHVQKRDPAIARLLLEDVLARIRLGDFNKNLKEEAETPRAVVALFTLDPVRALELLSTLPPTEWSSIEARADIISQVLLDELQTAKPKP